MKRELSIWFRLSLRGPSAIDDLDITSGPRENKNSQADSSTHSVSDPETGFWEAPKPAGCLYSIPHARTLTFLLELNPRTSLCAVAQPLPALAHGDLFRPEDGQDRLCGVLGIHAAGTKAATALFEVDFRDGQLRAAEAEESVAVSSQHSAFSQRTSPQISADGRRSEKVSRELRE